MERSGYLEVINIHKDKIRTQVFRIEETINKILNEDKLHYVKELKHYSKNKELQL